MATPSEETSWVAPGQTLTRKFPVTGERRASESLSLETWRLAIDGAVVSPVSLDFSGLLALPRERLKADIHCVTGWSQLDMPFEGVRLRDVLRRCVTMVQGAAFVRFEAYSDRGHDTSLPLETAMKDSWLVYHFDGKPLAPEHGFPVRVVTPSRYFYKSLKWLKRITLLETDVLGFWERTTGYHNQGDPWQEERFEGRRFTTAEEARRFRELVDFSVYRREEDTSGVILKADLRKWLPASRNLSGLRLKACDFRGADFRGVDFRGANLTLGKFRDARLEGADFSGADLEGADFVGAFMAGARMCRNPLSAAVFHASGPGGEGLRSSEGLRVEEPRGLLESQEAYLRSLGVLS